MNQTFLLVMNFSFWWRRTNAAGQRVIGQNYLSMRVIVGTIIKKKNTVILNML
jgi:hypothetical protein